MPDFGTARIDIRFAVFIIWAFLFLMFIVFPISIIYIDHILHRLCRFLGCTCWGWYVRPDVDEMDGSRIMRGTYYPFLPSVKKMEIKRLRMELIKRCLQRYSVWMMIDKDTVLIQEEENNEKSDYCASSDEAAELNVSKSVQSESSTDVESQFQDEENEQFTHLYIPYPGYDHDGIRISALPFTTKKTVIDGSKDKRRFGFIRNIWRKQQKAQAEPEPQSHVVIRLDEKRTASKFCAICLASYEPYDKISWSSNEGCTHAFHNECILTWLATLGDKWSRQQRFTDGLEPDELLRYELECPCCRQEFVSKDVICACCVEQEDGDSELENPAVSEHSV
ncbi:hypothetical protein ACHAXN_010647 [Cyclotella atomus]